MELFNWFGCDLAGKTDLVLLGNFLGERGGCGVTDMCPLINYGNIFVIGNISVLALIVREL